MRIIALLGALIVACFNADAFPLRFTWDANTDSPITTGYRLYGQVTSGGVVGAFNALGSTAGISTTNITVDVTPGAWVFYVTATGDGGVESDPSMTITYSASLPPALALNTPVITYLGAQRWSLTMSWIEPLASAGVTNYSGRLTLPGGTQTTFLTSVTSISFPSLSAGTYTFSVWGLNSSGAGPVTTTTIPILKPGTPKGLRTGI